MEISNVIKEVVGMEGIKVKGIGSGHGGVVVWNRT